MHNTKGQQWKEVDPDGVTTLYQYNAKGGVEYAAVDVNRNDLIDLGGLDRVTPTPRSPLSRLPEPTSLRLHQAPTGSTRGIPALTLRLPQLFHFLPRSPHAATVAHSRRRTGSHLHISQIGD